MARRVAWSAWLFLLPFTSLTVSLADRTTCRTLLQTSAAPTSAALQTPAHSQILLGASWPHTDSWQAPMDVTSEGTKMHTNSSLRVAIFMTTVLSAQHRQFFSCWEMATRTLPLLRNADLVLHVPNHGPPISQEELARFHMYKVTLRISTSAMEEKAKGAIQPLLEAFGGSRGPEEKWFSDYDWVIRLNPDVLIMDDTWLLQAMQNPSIDGIFKRCDPTCLIHSDFFAVRPSAVDSASVWQAPRENAEEHATHSFRNIL